MRYTFRCILDVEADVIRDIVIDSDNTLLNLHDAIVAAFGFSTQEIAAFYRTNEDWDQGEEIPLLNMNSSNSSNEMKDFKLVSIFSEVNSRILYIYDFLAMWTFFIELQKTDDEATQTHPKLSFSTGDLPNKVPDKQFTSEKITEDLDDDIENDFDSEFEDGLDIEDDLDNLY